MKVNLSKVKNIYMIGVKGVGMTMLAQYLTEKGFSVSGSDVPEVFMTEDVLNKCGIKIFTKFSLDNIPKNTDLIIYSTAYTSETNIEVMWALKSNIVSLCYGEVLGEIFDSTYGVAVIGTHGKTTTTAWLGYIMDKADLSPSVMVGAKVSQFDGNTLVGDSDYLVIEADEYHNKLQYYNPKAVLLNNIDYDHPDYFKTQKEYQQVFIDFLKKIPKKGFLVANYDDKIVRNVSEMLNTRVISYAINEIADYVAYNIKCDKNKQYFSVKLSNQNDLVSSELGEFCIKLSGEHNILNALAVIATSIEFNIDLSEIRTYLEDFTGTTRRMEVIGKFKGAMLVDEYAHHPTEVRATLAGVKRMYPNKKIITVFQPHTFSRTKALLNDFANCFQDTDSLIILDIYGSAREAQGGVHTSDLMNLIRNNNQNINARYIPTLEEAEIYLREILEKNDLVLFMGAGDVSHIGVNLLKI